MLPELDASYWERFKKTTGGAGIVAFVMVFFAASLNGGFDLAVWLLSLGALFICWLRTWVLVPIHLRNERAEEDEWNRFFDSDWRFVSSVADLFGTELDELRALFRSGNDTKVRAWIQLHWGGMDSEEVQEFMRFFNDQFMDTISAYIDDTGRLQPFD